MTKKLFFTTFTSAFLLITLANLLSFSSGIGGRTRKQIGEPKIYNITADNHEILVSENLKPGTYKINWNAVNLSSGIYFYRMTAEGYSETKK